MNRKVKKGAKYIVVCVLFAFVLQIITVLCQPELSH
jgi:hypothetical protein